MERSPTFRELLHRARGIDTRYRTVEAGVRWAAVTGLALASVPWVGPGLATVGAALGWVGIGVHTVGRLADTAAVLRRAPDEDGLLVTAWAVEQGEALGDAGLARQVLERGLVRLESSEAALVCPLSWPWLATGLALVSLLLLPLPQSPVLDGTSSSAAGDAPVEALSGPLARTAMGAMLANFSGVSTGTRDGHGAAPGTASSMRPNTSGAAAGSASSATGSASDGEGAGEAGVAAGRTAARDSPLVGPTLPDPERWLAPGDGKGTGEEGRSAPGEERPGSSEDEADAEDADLADEAALARAGSTPDERDSTTPLSPHSGESDGRLSDQSEDLEDFRIDEGQIGPSKEEVSREASSGKPGAMGSNDAPGLDDRRAEVAVAEAEVAREWVEAKLRSSPEGVIREVARGRTGQRSEVGYRDLVLQYSAVAEATLHDDEIPTGRRDLVRAYFDALQEDSDESSDDR